MTTYGRLTCLLRVMVFVLTLALFGGLVWLGWYLVSAVR